MFLVLVRSFLLFSQESINRTDTLLVQQDSVITDTVSVSPNRSSENAIDLTGLLILQKVTESQIL